MTERPEARPSLQGVALGLGAALSWGFYNVGLEIGQEQGFAPADLTLLRFSVAALVMLPLLLHAMPDRVALLRLCALTIVAGPPFALLITTGFSLAPLSHAVVISPSMSMLTANGLVWLIDGRRPDRAQIVGMSVILLGLLAIALDQPTPKRLDGSVLLGDLCFVASGALRGVFTRLMGRWRMPAVTTTGWIAVLSTLLYGPVYIAIATPPDMPVTAWLLQAVLQGAIGGSGAIVLYAAAVGRLGTGRAALFSAMVPPLAVMLGVPLVGVWPSLLQCLGVVLLAAGLTLSLEPVGRRLGLLHDRAHPML